MKLDNKIRELIAVGASVTANCHPCLQYHREKALASGVQEEEIEEAVEVGKLVSKGAAAEMNKFATSLLQKSPALAAAADSGCGCSSQ